MIDKSLVKRRFKKSLATYYDNAIVQKQMAEKLIKLLPEKTYNTVFEIGCSTGVLTKEITENIKYNKIVVNDIVPEAKQYIDNILPNYTFISGDIEALELKDKYDLIISNACIQWCNDIKAVINKLYKNLNKEGVLAVSVFGDSNFKELNNIFEFNEKKYSVKELKEILKDYDNYFITEDKTEILFDNLKELLQHIKYTGANSVREYTLTKTTLKNYEIKYKNYYSKNDKLVLTYNPVYIIIKC